MIKPVKVREVKDATPSRLLAWTKLQIIYRLAALLDCVLQQFVISCESFLIHPIALFSLLLPVSPEVVATKQDRVCNLVPNVSKQLQAKMHSVAETLRTDLQNHDADNYRIYNYFHACKIHMA